MLVPSVGAARTRAWMETVIKRDQNSEAIRRLKRRQAIAKFNENPQARYQSNKHDSDANRLSSSWRPAIAEGISMSVA
jgi:hypothetical protein